MIHFLLTAVICVALLIFLMLMLCFAWVLYMSIRGVVLTRENCAKLTRNVIRSLVSDYDIINAYTPLGTINEHIEAQFKIISDWKGKK